MKLMMVDLIDRYVVHVDCGKQCLSLVLEHVKMCLKFPDSFHK